MEAIAGCLVRGEKTIMFKVRRMTKRTSGLNKFSHIDLMEFTVNILFKISRKNNIRVFNIEMKFNTLVKRGHSKNSKKT